MTGVQTCALPISTYLTIYVTGTKVQSATSVNPSAKYSFKYNKNPTGNTYMNQVYVRSQSSDAENNLLYFSNIATSIAPIVNYGNKQYLVWRLTGTFDNMTAVSALYRTKGVIYLLGFVF